MKENEVIIEANNMKQAKKQIYEAWIGAVMVGVVSIVVFSVAILKGNRAYNLGSILFMLPIFVLAFGIFKKNRSCAIIMLALTVLETVSTPFYMPIEEWFKASWLVVRGAMIYVFFEGVRGTFAYRKLLNLEKERNKQ